MRVLGLHNGHDPSAALVVDGELVVFIEEERLNRCKHGVGILELHALAGTQRAPLPDRALRYCLDAAGLRVDDLDAVVVTNDQPDLAARVPIADPARVYAMPAGTHHLAHAVGAFFASPFDDATVLVYDHTGSSFERGEAGEAPTPLSDADLAQRLGPSRALHAAPAAWVYESESVFTFDRRADVVPERILHNLHPLTHMGSHGLGAMYAAICILTGFYDPKTGWDEPGKLMGLSGYGRPLDAPWGLLEHAGPDFDFDPFARWLAAAHQGTSAKTADLAHEAQRVLEHCALQLARWARAHSASRNLCLSGGVALNVHANALIERSGLFDRVFVMPACSDAGNAIGAAFWFAAAHGDAPQPLTHAYLGRTYADAEVDRALVGYESERLADDVLYERVSALLADGDVVAWVEGGAEAGPRALGHRSLLADPRTAAMRDHLNIDVKGREPFRPLAPAVCSEDAAAYFDVGEAPFMLRAATVRPHRRAQLGAVVHVDGTARPQTVRAEVSPRLHALLRAFERHSGVPVLLNTSFNGPGQPIVETPAQALDAIWTLEIDALVLHDRLVAPPDVCAAQLAAIVDAEAQLDAALSRPRHQPWVRRIHQRFGLDSCAQRNAMAVLLNTCTPGRPQDAALGDLPDLLRARFTRFLLRQRLLFRVRG